MIIGIDIGGTTTDIVGFKGERIIDLLTVTADDPIASASGALGKFINVNNLSLSEIKRIAITGVGSSYIKTDLFGIPTKKVDEFKAVGLGGAFLADLNKALVVSMGTGTAIVSVNGNSISHLGGSGVGGGTLLGLGKGILNTSDFEKISSLAKSGSLDNVDLTIGDISQNKIGNLQKNVTASNFGDLNNKASENDYALGILNLVFQTIGMLSVFAAKTEGNKDIILTGKLAQLQEGKEILNQLKSAKLFDVNFNFPEQGEYATAIGAAMAEANK